MYSRYEMKNRILLRLRRDSDMSTEQLAREMRAAYSSVREALMELKASKEVCISSWKKTGAKPIRYWSLGASDAPPPPPMTTEQRNQARRESRRLVKITDASDAKPILRRDPAASWF